MATETQPKEPYWNGKTSDHPEIQEMIRLDNQKYQHGPNKFSEFKGTVVKEKGAK